MTTYQDFPPALMVLSPRLTKAGDVSSSVVGINTIPLADGAVVYCIENKLMYRLDRTSIAAPDGNLILAPLTGPGRWNAAVASGSSCFVQSGYDQPPATILAATTVGSAPMPRDGIGTPLQVFFPSVKRGNVVEVYWAATVGNPGGDGNVTEAQFTALVSVAFVPAPVLGDFFAVGNSQAGSRIPPPVGPLQSDSNYQSMGMTAAFTVPAGIGDTVPLTVWLFYSASHDVIVGGSNLAGFIPGVSLVLKATEYEAGCVTQPGPFVLFAPEGG